MPRPSTWSAGSWTGPSSVSARARPQRGLGLHQGSPLSPLLCNLYLDAFDRAMLGSGYRVIRYSDDIAIPVARPRGGRTGAVGRRRRTRRAPG